MPGMTLDLSRDQLAEMLGIRLDGRASDGFFYALNLLAVPAGGTQQGTIQISTEAGFLALDVRAWVFSNGAVVAPGSRLLTIRMEIAGSGRSWTSAPTALDNIAGTAERPAPFPMPGVLPPGGTLSVELNNGGADPADVRLTFGGFKVFDFSPQGMR